MRFTNEKQRDFVYKIFEKCGISALKTEELSFEDEKTDIDVLGIYENILIFVECVGSTQSLGEKAKKFKTDAELLTKNLDSLIQILENDYGLFYKTNKSTFTKYRGELIIKKMLVDLNKESIEKIQEDKNKNYIINLCNNNQIFLWTYEEYFYFDKASNTEFKYAKYRIFEFLKINPEQLKESLDEPLTYLAVGNKTKEGMYILNMIIPINILLKRCSIKRLQSWDPEGFQRLIESKKIEAMRQYLIKEMEVYPNNLIVLLREDTNAKVINSNEIEFNISNKSSIPDLKRNMMKKIFLVQIPNTYDAFCIIDGQHRLFSYAQTEYAKYKLDDKIRRVKEEDKKREIAKQLAKDDRKVDELSQKNSLLVTGILCAKPPKIKMGKLFLDINQKQTYIRGEDLIDLNEKLYPYSVIAKANQLLKKLNKEGILLDKIKFKPWQEERIKRTSLIRYSGLKDIFRSNCTSNEIFNVAHKKQRKIRDYTNFCFILINNFLTTVINLLEDKYTRKGKVRAMRNDCILKQYYIFSAVFVGALFRLLRHFISEKESEFRILERINLRLKKNMNDNIDNKSLQDLFKRGLQEIIVNFTFTKKEFQSQKGWGPNKWGQIEADLFYIIRSQYPNFGDETLISSRYRK